MNKQYSFTDEEVIVLSNMVRLDVKDKVAIDYIIGSIKSRIWYAYHYKLFKIRLSAKKRKDEKPVPDFEFGDHVVFEKRMARNGLTSIVNSFSADVQPSYLYWEETPLLKSDTGRGLFIGYRTLRNGFVHRFEADVGNVTARSAGDFESDITVKVALVCKNGACAPLRVSIHGMRKA